VSYDMRRVFVSIGALQGLRELLRSTAPDRRLRHVLLLELARQRESADWRPGERPAWIVPIPNLGAHLVAILEANRRQPDRAIVVAVADRAAVVSDEKPLRVALGTLLKR
jgi:hypothetical protein